jgi:hypothetical protein
VHWTVKFAAFHLRSSSQFQQISRYLSKGHLRYACALDVCETRRALRRSLLGICATGSPYLLFDRVRDCLSPYLGMLVFAESTFALMAIREYQQDALKLEERELIFGVGPKKLGARQVS